MRGVVELFRELIEHAARNKKWWLIPVILALFLLGFLLTTAGTSQVPVFIYPVA